MGGRSDPRARASAQAVQEGLLLQNIHLVARWLGTLEKLVERHSLGSHTDYRVFMSAEPAPSPEAHIIPQGLLENAIKTTSEPPTGMHANLHKALHLFTQAPSPHRARALRSRFLSTASGQHGRLPLAPGFRGLSIFGRITADTRSAPGASPAPGLSSSGCPEPPCIGTRCGGQLVLPEGSRTTEGAGLLVPFPGLKAGLLWVSAPSTQPHVSAV